MTDSTLSALRLIAEAACLDGKRISPMHVAAQLIETAIDHLRGADSEIPPAINGDERK